MSALELLNPNAENVNKTQALAINLAAARGLQEVLKSNLGPKGTLKMLVGGAGQIKLTKDGNTLLHEMQIQHPTAQLIARAATATDDTVGDGTTSTVLFVGELLKQAERYLGEGLHPRVLADGFDVARDATMTFLEEFSKEMPDLAKDREQLCNICRTTLQTKLREELVNKLTDIVVDAILCIRRDDQPIDLHMVELLHMQHKLDLETRLVRGMVLDHGARHPGMPSKLEKVWVMTLNVSLEYEKSEVTSNFLYKTAEEREGMVVAERKFTDDKVKQIIEFKKQICEANPGTTFLICNQKGIDPPSLDMLAKEGILALRRAKRRNMERLTLACGGMQINSVEELDQDMLGYAELVYEDTLGEDKFTFVEGVRNPHSCTILVKGQNPHTIAQIKDAVRDGLRSVKNAIDNPKMVAGAGAFEIAAYANLEKVKADVRGRAKLGVQAFADALLVIPKALADNSGFDVQNTIIDLQEAYQRDPSKPVGLDVISGKPIFPEDIGVWDGAIVKKSVIHMSSVLASQLLLVDSMLRAGRGSRPKDPNMPDM
ncbi:T-complex protein 1 subunit zeta [Hondaea fermentalgiana]|uniref:T-complex protein 1 subunit zeta n=1 Tax=Hondaea fermentalgiana TaxID=2315210 RepID=A0A2R5G3N8_9STRA|nr:T-complex protein 1 subunit zeta [Hondaea fermentalgiana]|eukprot:GBG25145.1 T-complex protein 1 subunit zeta [Hondaea fermentalgiana]